MKILITASILAADLGHLQEEIESVEKAGADWIQVDVMDGHFVPNVSFDASDLKGIRTKLPLDIHLMVTNPAERIDAFVNLGAKHITFHAEAVPKEKDQIALVKMIRDKGCTAGIAINPETHQDAIHTMDLDMVLCMTVHPGFSGQKFIADVLPKMKEIRQQHPDVMIQVDGGIDEKTAPLCIAAGATNLVSASAIFQAKDRAKMIAKLRET
ncbi:ribulose-phosphate 3-epimerase [Candidatus Peribacteria bacterium RIFCSPHIGHO2_02_FULL_52_16]|nr:MAG: ribulose-phosphate 3-epimerase [Candidatus Peribacteria bacterium RIFCSPHIGHO2_01_FULL_51_35]OGJ61420.1 MAG: ribulose-phosphate 3-epimerase [Candidatus Peribacteria bacterium RIFCSPHIGHO2_02_FULL_52_16]